MNIFDYVEKYGDKTFEEKEFTDIDNMIFSLLTYLDFTNTSINEGKYYLEYIGKEYLKNNKYKEVSKIGVAQKDAYNLLKRMVQIKRYRKITISNYIYEINKDIQFSAVTFDINKDLRYIAFEGTDEKISGWKEDCELAHLFPIPAQERAISYVNKHVKLFGPKVIIGGHSKGGNLALVSSMFMNFYKKFKVIKVYNNDGPGLRKKEFTSKKYKHLKKKYIHIVPDSSIIGILLRNDQYKVVKSTKTNIYAHSMSTWVIEDDKLVESELSEKSKALEQSIISWLDKHTDEERSKMTRNLFEVFEKEQIEETLSLKNVKNIIKVIRGMRKIDQQTKELAIEFITYNYKNVNK